MWKVWSLGMAKPKARGASSPNYAGIPGGPPLPCGLAARGETRAGLSAGIWVVISYRGEEAMPHGRLTHRESLTRLGPTGGLRTANWLPKPPCPLGLRALAPSVPWEFHRRLLVHGCPCQESRAFPSANMNFPNDRCVLGPS